MISKQNIEQFYRDVKSLGLKFPVAEITRATGHSKGNVSRYLSKKLEPSEQFLKAFYEQFPISSKNVSRETDEPLSKNIGALSIESLMRENQALSEANRDLAVSNKVLSLAHEKLVDKILNTTVNDQQQIAGVSTSTLDRLLVSLAEIGVGTLEWKSIEEGVAVLRSRVFPGTSVSLLKDTQIDEGKKHKGSLRR